MDVGDLSNAAGLAASGAAVFGPATTSATRFSNSNTANINIDNNNSNNFIDNGNPDSGGQVGASFYPSAGWWTPSSTLVTAPANADVMNQLCRVCGEPAAGFHFGAFTCEGCKSFFGRTYNNLGSISECKNGGVCVINKKNRTACKACRLRKCLMVGMSKSGSRYGRRSNWFKIHCLLQEQSHQAQQRLKESTKLPFDKVASLDAANNNTNNNNNNNSNFAAASGLGMPDRKEDPILSPRLPPRPDLLPHELLRPEITRFPLWRGPPFFHPLSPIQLLNTPFFPFQQRFMVPYINNQASQQVPVTSLSSSSSESVSPRSTPSPKEFLIEKSETSSPPIVGDKGLAFLRSLGPEQEEPMDLSRKSSEVKDILDESCDSDDSVDEKPVIADNLQEKVSTDANPPLDLSWKT
ncbi:nuclear receptor subfamily 1 group D member 2-like [Cotesia glomerata]|uniref:Nuclear receptor domain-containing protein n=1 Tax=Cotesia glomerata TaxID=32391 RepID=A0AAV7IB90_COTGL|nr:nuclear receptor subfamily 1 group D member 2-like [Cotesia glomerata]XP_044580417.1 nuclear receptor subfamily 1 group D member 2-like [Cotesia glomerata]XP_044580418.1 nuclear receptor subfamily 1 group D member 2-like [Cotesia glomerata]KAH0549535.1 hypothetical protein KQX54_010180 [Cotesia glomerata]